MPDIIQNTAAFRATRAWGARDLALIAGASVRLHWTDVPYHWHTNTGNEVFAVLHGVVDMHYKDTQGNVHVTRLNGGDIFVAHEGDSHVAHPVGEARILVIENEGSE
jgi:mannose-6-phosphate isomerase-like protein (cupin superfamily)